MIDSAFAGHAGEAGIGLPMPHEIMSGLALVAGLALLSLVLLSFTTWKVHRIERRLRRLEERLAQIEDKLPHESGEAP